MNTLIVYHSHHHGNTEKVAAFMAKRINADLVKASEADPEMLRKYDIIGFGSGVYNSRLHNDLEKLIEGSNIGKSKKVFLFSTTGSKTYSTIAHNYFKDFLAERNIATIGEFSCPGFDTAISNEGINRGRPDEKDFKQAKEFIDNILKNIKS